MTSRPSTIIRASSSPFDWRLGQLWRYRDLILLFVWRDFVAVYKQTILGPAWHLLRPLTTTGIFTVVFAGVAKLSTDGIPPFLFYLSGTLAWTYFASCLDQTARTFVGHAHLLGKVYFHRLVIPLSLVLSNLVAFAIQFAIFVTALVAFKIGGAQIHLTAWAFASPLLLVMLAGYGLGGGIIVCALTTRFRDLAHLVTFGVQLLMYLTPVIYPTSFVPIQYRWVVNLNPLTPLLEAFRLGFLGEGTVTVGAVASSLAVLVVLLVVGLSLFTRAERTFMDTV